MRTSRPKYSDTIRFLVKEDKCEQYSTKRKPVVVSTPFLHDQSDFFAFELNLNPSSRVPFDTAIEFALCAKTFPSNRVTGIAAVTRAITVTCEVWLHVYNCLIILENLS